MEFEDEDDHDEEEEEEEEVEEDDDGKGITIPPPARPMSVTTANPATGASSSVGAPQLHTSSGGSRYRECQKNHAVSIGGHAVDGCGEFMPAGDDGTLDALKCAACGCHRNFHRKETDFSSATTSPPGAAGTALQYPLPPPPPPPQHPSHLPYYRGPPPAYVHNHQHHPRPLALPSTTAHEMEELSNPTSSGGGKKRHRTKFTAEQKERMVEFAESIGWRIQKHDEAAVEQFCRELHVSRQVLKVWLHNNKHTLGRKP